MKSIDIVGRKTIVKTIKRINEIAFGRLLWSAYLSKVKASQSYIIKPPSALSKYEFIKLCIKCSLYLESYPFNTIKLAKLEDNTLIDTPLLLQKRCPITCV